MIVHRKRKLDQRSSIIIYCVTIVAFILSSLQWIAATATIIVKIVAGSPSEALYVMGTVQLIMNAILLLNRQYDYQNSHRSLGPLTRL